MRLALLIALALTTRSAEAQAPKPGASAVAKPASTSKPASATKPTSTTKPSSTTKPAADARSTSGKPGAAAEATESDRTRHNPDKTRVDSVLESDKLLPGRVDLRSEAERRRDAELRTHFSRLAALDAIAALARERDDVDLQEDVEQVRRKELQRHQKAMIAFRRATTQQPALAAGAQP